MRDDGGTFSTATLAWLTAVHGLSIAFLEISVGKAEAAERRLREAREFLALITDE